MLEQARESGTSIEQVLNIRMRDTHAGSSKSSGVTWVNKLLSMYEGRRSMCFGPGVQHINVVADPASHSKHEVMVSVVYSWEQGEGGIADAQWFSANKTILPLDQDMPSHLATLAMQGRLERVAAFKQLQVPAESPQLRPCREFPGRPNLQHRATFRGSPGRPYPQVSEFPGRPYPQHRATFRQTRP